MRYLDLEELLMLHFKIIEDFGGSHGVREEGRLASVVAAPSQEVFGKALFPTAYEEAAVYGRGIIADHPFVDGNKRTAITAAAIFLSRHQYRLTASPKKLEDFAVQVAVEHLGIPKIAIWLKAHTSKI